MADLSSKNSSVSQAHNSAHRRMLAAVGQNTDSASDRDGTSDDENDLLELPRNDGEVFSILGVSMSRAQTHMKSAHTPAYEKVQALEKSRGYFEPGSLVDGPLQDSASEDAGKDEKTTDSAALDEKPAPWKSQQPSDRRYSITRAILGHGSGRKRSSSGPTTVLDSIRKVFTDLPSYPGFGASVKEQKAQDPTRTVGSPLKHEVQGSRQRARSVAQPLFSATSRTGLDGAASSTEHDEPHPRILRRSTSDHSLYLRRAVTGASRFDDTTVYSNVAEMPNNRFKAITDSFADSSLKMPKFPGVNLLSSRSSSIRTMGDLTKTHVASGSDMAGVSNPALRKKLQAENSSTRYADPSEHKHPILSDALAHATGDMVVMGGYRGSVLRSAEPPYHQLWVPVKVGLGMRKADLEVGLSHEDEERMEESIIPSGILSHIGPIDIARRFLKKLRKCSNVQSDQLRIHDWGYDWRLSPHFLCQKLIRFLEGLPCNQPGVPVDMRGALVIAHSLGGLITRHAVNTRPELFSGVVYAGTPQNCCNILGPLRNGDDVLLSSRVLTAQVNFTLRTSYALLPEDGRCFLNKETGERYDVDFFNVDNWSEYRLSPCINSALPTQSTPRKGIVESISDSISSFSSKRTSWFSNPLSTEPSTTSSTHNTAKEEVTEIKDDIASTAKKAAEHIPTPKQEAQDSLEPSMKPSSHKPSVATAVSIPKDKALEYLTRTLAEVKQFKAELAHIPAYQDANRYPPHAIIYGKTVPTVYGAKVASREAIKQTDAYDDLAFAAGDGVVLASAAQLPAGYRCVTGGRVESERGHIGLLGDLEGVGQCIMAVIEGRKRGIGLALP